MIDADFKVTYMARSIGPSLRKHWERISNKPGGKWLFSRILGYAAPYTGSIGANILTLSPGHCVVTMRDRRRVRNHLNSIHAMALCNLGEIVTGVALMNSLPDKTRGILSSFSIEYKKKARGLLVAECHCDVPSNNEECEYALIGKIRNSNDELVAIAKANWLIGPEKQSGRTDV